MGCEYCEGEAGKRLATPDVTFSQHTRNVAPPRKVGANMLLGRRRGAMWRGGFDPRGGAKCQGKGCAKNVGRGEKLCGGGAYQGGKCRYCGGKILDVLMYRQSNL